MTPGANYTRLALHSQVEVTALMRALWCRAQEVRQPRSSLVFVNGIRVPPAS